MPNWKSPCPGGFQGYWLKDFKSERENAKQLNECLQGNAVTIFRSITCLPVMKRYMSTWKKNIYFSRNKKGCVQLNIRNCKRQVEYKQHLIWFLTSVAAENEKH